MDSQTKVFRAHRAISWLYGAIGAGLTAVIVFALLKGDGHALAMLPGAMVFALLFAAHHFTARSCKQGKRGGRIASIVIACVMLIGVPVGTLIGIYLLSNTWRPWPKAA